MSTKKRKRDWSQFRKKDLQNECKSRGWRSYSRLNKQDLIVFMQQHSLHEEQLDACKAHASNVIKRAIRKWRSGVRVVNEMDIFSMEPVEPGVEFRVLCGPSAFHRFDVRTLMKYVITEGKFTNPFTRTAFSDADLRRLCRFYFQVSKEQSLEVELGGRKFSISPVADLVMFRKLLTNQRHEERERERLVDAMETQANAVMELCFQIIAELPCVDATVVSCIIFQIVNVHIPQLFETVDVLVQADESTARDVLCEFVVWSAVNAFFYDDVRRDMLLCVFKLLDVRYQTIFRACLVSEELLAARRECAHM